MKKRILSALFVLVFARSSYLKADNCGINCCLDRPYTIKARIAAFLPAGDRFKDIYGKAMPSYQIEATTPLFDCYEGWANVDYLDKNGKSTRLQYFTNVKVVTLSLGLLRTFSIYECMSLYLGLGVSGSYLYIHNRFTNEHRSDSNGAYGIALKSGLTYDISQKIFADLFADYLFQPAQLRTKVNLGGFKIGVGLGYRF